VRENWDERRKFLGWEKNEPEKTFSRRLVRFVDLEEDR